METVITEEIIAWQPAEDQAIIRLLRATIGKSKAQADRSYARMEELEAHVRRLPTRIAALKAKVK